jgi:preprotein translocase subunit SecE
MKAQMLQKIQEFFKEVSVELKKVSWPTRQQTVNATVVVIVVSFIVAFFLGIVDIVLARIVGSIMK